MLLLTWLTAVKPPTPAWHTLRRHARLLLSPPPRLHVWQVMGRVADKEALVPNSEEIVSKPREMIGNIDPAQPFSFTVECEVCPPLTWVKSYKDCQVKIR